MNKNTLILGTSALALVGIYLFMKNKNAQKSIDSPTSSESSKDSEKETEDKKPSKGKATLSKNGKEGSRLISNYQRISPLGNTKGENVVSSTTIDDLDFSQPSRRDCRKEAREQGIKPYQIRKTIDYVNQCKREGGFDSGFDGSYNFNTSAFDTDTEQFAFNGHTF